MCEKDLLVAYLYEDLTAADRAAFEAHMRECAECRDELKALGAVRGDLAEWAPPQPDLGFRLVRGASDTGHVLRLPPSSWRAWWTPAAGLAAAAVLVLAAASALAHVEVHRGPDGVTVRTGWGVSAPAAGQDVAAKTAGPSQDVRLTASSPVDAAFLTALDRRLKALEAASSHDSGLRNVSATSARAADAEIFRRVRDLLAQSETKQQDQLALRIAQVLHDVDAQRVADLTRIQQGLRGIEASVTAEAAGHRELTNYILTSGSGKQK
jgi:anti-sigma factor RsiW